MRSFARPPLLRATVRNLPRWEKGTDALLCADYSPSEQMAAGSTFFTRLMPSEARTIPASDQCYVQADLPT
jgi:hypothetical protein